MSQVTTCPGCRSRFQVSDSQLQAHQGLVRCGVCKTVFNARDHLGTRPQATIAASDAPISIQSRLLRPSLTDTPAGDEAPAPAAPPTQPVPAPAAAPPRPSLASGAAFPGAEDDLPPLLLDAIKPRHTYPALWVALVLGLVLALAGQFTFFNRTYLAAQYPGLAPALQSLCHSLGCRVGLMRAPDQLLLETASLEGVAGHPGVYALNALLQNQASFSQDYPWLELTLTNEADVPVGRRIFAPGAYLPRATPAATGMKPHSETEIKLLLKLNGLTAAGYHVYLFFPPTGR